MASYSTVHPTTLADCVCPECGEPFDDPPQGVPVIQERPIVGPNWQLGMPPAMSPADIERGCTPRWAVLMHPECARWDV